MKKILFTGSVLLCTLWACKPKAEGYTLTVISGNAQSGEVNSELPEPVRVQLLRGSEEIGYKQVRFETSTGQTLNATTNEQGIAEFNWSIGCETGTQTASISALDPGTVLAGTSASATGILPASGWYRPCGIPASALYFPSIFQSSSGKLFAAGNQSVYASDDNGKYWYEVSGLSGVIRIKQFGNTLYALGTFGILRSDNDGIQWQSWTPLAATELARSGSYWYATRGNGDMVYSNDEGLNWLSCKGNFSGQNLQFMFTNPSGIVLGVSNTGLYYFLQDSLLKRYDLSTNTVGYYDSNNMYFGAQGNVMVAQDTLFSTASSYWNFSAMSSASRNLKKYNGAFYISQFADLYRYGTNGVYFSSPQLNARLLDYLVLPDGAIIMSYEGIGLVRKQ